MNQQRELNLQASCPLPPWCSGSPVGWFLLALCPGQRQTCLWHRQQEQSVRLDWEKLRCTHCGVLKVVQTVVCEDEPPPLPGFYSSPCGAETARVREAQQEMKREKWAPKHQVEQQTGRQMYGQTDRWRLQRTPHPENHHHHSCRVFSSLGVFLSLYICWFSTPTFQLQVLAT